MYKFVIMIIVFNFLSCRSGNNSEVKEIVKSDSAFRNIELQLVAREGLISMIYNLKNNKSKTYTSNEDDVISHLNLTHDADIVKKWMNEYLKNGYQVWYTGEESKKHSKLLNDTVQYLKEHGDEE